MYNNYVIILNNISIVLCWRVTLYRLTIGHSPFKLNVVSNAPQQTQMALATLHVAQYYGVPRLVHLCERRLGRLLTGRSGETAPEEAAALAPALLALADDSGLAHLRAVALDFIVNHHESVRATPGYAALSRDQVLLIADEACALHGKMVRLLRSMSRDGQALPEPSYS